MLVGWFDVCSDCLIARLCWWMIFWLLAWIACSDVIAFLCFALLVLVIFACLDLPWLIGLNWLALWLIDVCLIFGGGGGGRIWLIDLWLKFGCLIWFCLIDFWIDLLIAGWFVLEVLWLLMAACAYWLMIAIWCDRWLVLWLCDWLFALLICVLLVGCDLLWFAVLWLIAFDWCLLCWLSFVIWLWFWLGLWWCACDWLIGCVIDDCVMTMCFVIDWLLCWSRFDVDVICAVIWFVIFWLIDCDWLWLIDLIVLCDWIWLLADCFDWVIYNNNTNTFFFFWLIWLIEWIWALILIFDTDDDCLMICACYDWLCVCLIDMLAVIDWFVGIFDCDCVIVIFLACLIVICLIMIELDDLMWFGVDEFDWIDLIMNADVIVDWLIVDCCWLADLMIDDMMIDFGLIWLWFLFWYAWFLLWLWLLIACFDLIVFDWLIDVIVIVIDNDWLCWWWFDWFGDAMIDWLMCACDWLWFWLWCDWWRIGLIDSDIMIFDVLIDLWYDIWMLWLIVLIVILIVMIWLCDIDWLIVWFDSIELIDCYVMSGIVLCLCVMCMLLWYLLLVVILLDAVCVAVIVWFVACDWCLRLVVGLIIFACWVLLVLAVWLMLFDWYLCLHLCLVLAAWLLLVLAADCVILWLCVWWGVLDRWWLLACCDHDCDSVIVLEWLIVDDW